MLRWFGSLRLPLAAKCELLFGAAVCLVILAAVFIPWLRMEQLTSKLNEQTAEALVSNALDEHIAYWQQQAGEPTPDVKFVMAAHSPVPAAAPATSTPVAPVTSAPVATAPAASAPVAPATTAPVATAPATTAPVATAPATTAPVATATTAPVATAPATTTAPVALATTAPSTMPADPQATLQYGPAQLFLMQDFTERSNQLAQRTLREVQRNPAEDRYWKLMRQEDDSYRYRFGRLLYFEPRCVPCHNVNTPTTLPVAPNVLGIATVEFPSQVEKNQLLLNRLFIAIAALFAGTLAVLFFYLIISRLILKPVRVLQETAEKVSEGDLNLRTHIHSGDEFQLLSQTFNRMLENLKGGEDQLRAINQTLDLKLAELSESNLALYESNRLKSEFLANVSHELRTPLNSILGFAELLKDGAKTDPKTARYVQNIMSSGRSLLDLINDLLDLAKIEAGKMEVRAVELSLSDLFEGLAGILRPLLEPKSLTIKVQIANDVPLMQTDAAKLQQILYNLLSNAIKFSPAGQQIELSAVRPADLRVRISVRDHGPGIAQEKQLLIFEKFRQIDASHTRQHGGTGLGLAISRDLTTLLGGKIGVETEEGQGATFWIELPIRIDPATADVRSRA